MNSIYIRKRTMRSGRVYLYLQYYPPIRNPRTNKAIRWEALKLEMFPNPKTTFEREHNKSMIEMAEIIKSKRMMLLAGESYGFIDKTRKREDAIRYFEQVCKQKGGKWGAALLHFVSSKVDFHQSGIEKGTRERVRSKVTKFGYHYKFLSSF